MRLFQDLKSYAILRHSILFHVMLFYATPCHGMLWYDVSFNIFTEFNSTEVMTITLRSLLRLCETER